ncbi:MAG TPA: VanZ family protein [Flavitalea sp.]|nr:VanZ family protein [Flavitalea sp.]
MAALFRRLIHHKFFPAAWTIFTVFLLCIPGSVVPGTGLFGLKGFDKIVHVFLFGSNVLLWGWFAEKVVSNSKKLRNIFIMLALYGILLGIIMEFVQRDYVPNRSFDMYDIIADAVGAMAAAIYLRSKQSIF